jgi:formate hydrogenlyase subunit 6/NADH:ubiquinone oxidoreductase subunit I
MCESRCPKKAITMVEIPSAATEKKSKAQEPVAV